jgi:hypothetical protein
MTLADDKPAALYDTIDSDTVVGSIRSCPPVLKQWTVRGNDETTVARVLP